MNSRLLDTVTIITAIILIPAVGASVYALYTGQLTYSAYTEAWREPLALLLGFWLRGVDKS